MRHILTCAAVATLAVAGCGGDDGSADKDSTSSAASAPRAVAPPPAELLGTYTTTLKRSDVPKPALTIAKPPDDVLESSATVATGESLKLTGEECAQQTGDTLVSSAYRWQREGDDLRLTAVEHGCADKVAETILTAEPWKRSG